MAKKPWHKGAYDTQSRKLVAAARANPETRCWRCGRTLAEHRPHRTGRPATWHAGHLIDSMVGSPLLPEASTCNTKASVQARRPRRARRTNLTW